MTPRQLRTLRGAAAAWVATVVAATSHTLAGGGAPAPALVGVIGVLASPVGIALVGRRLSAWRVGAAAVTAQLLFHVAFALTAGVDPAASAGHAHHGAPAVLTGSAHLSLDAPMVVAHVVAAAATVVGLFGGERMLRALGRGIRTLLRRTVVSVSRPLTARQVSAPAVADAPALRAFLSVLSRRGPPARVDAVA
ncbi:hypothetical protein ACFUTX_14970 [Microbacterium sp. NPDC057407]|uniref:hypothetical protein n=1 Tax=Microbacterium sp. NPDC057407 TaxID=3346120 RepID=UPI00366F16D9